MAAPPAISFAFTGCPLRVGDTVGGKVLVPPTICRTTARGRWMRASGSILTNGRWAGAPARRVSKARVRRGTAPLPYAEPREAFQDDAGGVFEAEDITGQA